MNLKHGTSNIELNLLINLNKIQHQKFLILRIHATQIKPARMRRQ